MARDIYKPKGGTLTIPSSDTTSDAWDQKANGQIHSVGIPVSGGFTGTAISFRGRREGSSTFGPIQANGALYEESFSKASPFDTEDVVWATVMEPVALRGYAEVKVVSNDTETGERTLEITANVV